MGQGDPSRKAGINDLPMVLTQEEANKVFAERVKKAISEAVSCPDSPRYRALGNAVTVQVAEWIGRRILGWHVANP